MSDAKKCDRCGAFYETYVPKIVIKNDTGLRIITMDLCPDCSEELTSWLKNECYFVGFKEAADEPEQTEK